MSVRVTINNYESLISNAEKRAVRLGEREIVPRISDLHALSASTAGKLELEYAGEDKKSEELIERLLNRAVLKVFDKFLRIDELKNVVEYFANGWGVEVSDMSARRSTSTASAPSQGSGRPFGSSETSKVQASSPPPPIDPGRPPLASKLNKTVRAGGIGSGLRRRPAYGIWRLAYGRSALRNKTPFLDRCHKPYAISHMPVSTRYTQWDGSQRVRLTADQVFEKLSDLLSYTDDVQQGIEWLTRHGAEWEGMRVMGLDDFLEQVREQLRNGIAISISTMPSVRCVNARGIDRSRT